jgi:hypothetical protein
MSKPNNDHSIVEYCAVAFGFFFNDLLLVTQNGSVSNVSSTTNKKTDLMKHIPYTNLKIYDNKYNGDNYSKTEK